MLACRDPCGSRGSKFILFSKIRGASPVEILVDLVDLNLSISNINGQIMVEILVDLVDLNEKQF